MADESRVSELMNQWQAERARGRDVPVTELCRDCPELSAELARRIAIARQSRGVEGAVYATTATQFYDGGTGRRPETVWHAGPSPEPGDVPTHSGADGTRAAAPAENPQIAGHSSRYRPIRLHRTGGLGRVWLARDGVLGRDVALKELRADRVGDSRLRSRFLQEARITGQLEHPSIVPLYDLLGGADQDGKCDNPRYTMRFVAGRTLAEAIQDYHRRRRDGLATALDLAVLLDAFVAVCHAIAYAHSRKVLHRDIKGSNIVLGDFGEVFVLDWGLAKVMGEPDSSADTVRASASPEVTRVDPSQGNAAPRAAVTPSPSPDVTAEGAVIGTPSYMAPELAEGFPASMGTDMYALGVLLYVLLTGHLPYDGQSTLEVLEKIKSGDPPRPRALNASAPAALETICLKAMARSPATRYGTAEELAADIRRWRADEPVAAHAEPWTARLGRWSRRHRTAVAAGVVFLASAVVALTISTALVWQEERRTVLEKQHAEREWARAEVNLGTAHELAWNLVQIGEQRLSRVGQMETVRRTLTDTALEKFRQFLEQRPDDAELQERTAKLYRYSANLHRALGNGDVADRYYRESVGMYEALIARVPDEPHYRDMLAEALRDSSTLPNRVGRYREAVTVLRRAAGIAESLIHEFPDPAAYRRTLAWSHLELSATEYTMGQFAESARDARLAADTFRKLADAGGPQSHQYEPLFFAMAASRLAVAEREQGRFEEALAAHDQAIREMVALVERQKGNNDFEHNRWRFVYERGVTLARMPGRWPEAEQTFGEAIRGWTDLGQRHPGFDIYPEFQGRAFHARGHGRIAGRRDAAAADLAKAQTLFEALVKKSADVVDYRQELGRTYLSLGRLAQSGGDAEKAADWLAKARQALRQTLDTAPDNAIAKRSLDEVDAALAKPGP